MSASDYYINAVARRVVLSGSAGVGPYSFSFEILATTDVAVYKNSTKLTLTTDYSVTINANGTGTVTLVVAATGSDVITIVGAKDVKRVTDFVTAGDLQAASLNDQLDSQIIFVQQVDDKADRSIHFPVYDSTSLTTVLPAAASRANKAIVFDASGNVGVSTDDYVNQTAAAAASAAAALVSQNAAAASASAASSSASSASASASTATTQATNASNSATAASSSATSASNSASTASTQATNASNSAASALAIYGNTTAMNNAVAAAAASQSAAATSASNASTSATNASNSATSASNSASTATTQATNASNSASAASTSASNAAASASTASIQATNAANSASAAAASAAALPNGPSVGTGNCPQWNGSAWVGTAVGTGDMVKANNLSDLPNKATARTNLGVAIGADVQGYNANTAIGPGSSTANYVPQWNSTDGKTLKAGLAVGTAANNIVQLDASAKMSPFDINAAQTVTKPVIGSATALTSSGGSTAVNLALANNFTMALTENTTLANPTNIVAGQSGCIAITQHASAAKTVAYGSYWIEATSGTAPSVSTTTSAQNLLSYYVFDTTHIYYTLNKHGVA